jgi:thiol:disulfide interchange protein
MAVLAVGVIAAGTSAVSGQLSGLEVETRWALDADAVHPGGTVHAALKVTVPGKYHVQSNKPLDEFLIPTQLTVTPPEGLTVREVVYPESITLDAPGISDDPVSVFEQVFVIGIAIEVDPDVEPGTYPLAIVLSYQACDDKYCLAPTSKEFERAIEVVGASTPITKIESPLFETVASGLKNHTTRSRDTDDDCDIMAELDKFEVLGTTGGYLDAEDFIEFIDAAESGTVQRNLLADKGPLAIVLLVLLGGVLLNLTPCVLPLIPINLAIIGAGARAGSRTRGFALGGTYGLAMAAVYGMLGLVVTLTAAKFGAINSTIWFNVSIAILFVVLGLAMFDVVNFVDFSKFQSRFNMTPGAGKSSFVLAFGMGAISALLAGACVAPVVIQVIVYSSDQYTKGTESALALPFFLGLGMALPWPFAGAGLSFLPKPGVWMVRVKQGMGVFILAFAAYYGYLAWEIFDSTRVDPEAVAEAVKERVEQGWSATACEGLATAQAENKLVLIDMWATWCKNCLAMDKTTFEDPEVLARLESYVKIKYQAEHLNDSPASDVLDHFEGIGLPTYAILRPQGSANPDGAGG